MNKTCSSFCYYEYLQMNEAKLFTIALIPDNTGKFPTVIVRDPYVDWCLGLTESEIFAAYQKEYISWTDSGYAVVIQHCRGRGKSEGDCIPYINERADGLFLQEWIRKQSFYNGELFLKGGSYLTSVHYMTAPFAEDIKGAAFAIQDCERYNVCYRNGFLKTALHGDWYVGMYKANSNIKKNYSKESFLTLPLCDFTKTVFGESAEDFDEMLKHPDKNDSFWNTRLGGADSRDAIKDVTFPVLLETGFYDIYTGGIFDMWNKMNESTRKKSAFLVAPYAHGNGCIPFPDGDIYEKFGKNFEIEWFDYIRNLRKTSPLEQGKLTYYRLFENKWKTECWHDAESKTELALGKGKVKYVYNPYDPPRFNGGLCTTFGSAQFQDKPGTRYDIINIYTEPFKQDTFIKGKITAKLCVKTDCEDTCFYMRLSLTKEQGDYGIRDDITSVCYQHPDYVPNSEVMLDFKFDEHAFLIKKGECLRIDISSADSAHYVRHTNQKGLYSEQKTAKIANNTVVLGKSLIILPVE